jgi:hypothetical protein
MPVLASTAGGFGEQYAGSRWTCPPCSPEELATILARLLAAPPDERAWTAARMFTADMDSVVTAMHGVYDVTAKPAENVLAQAVAKARSQPDAP